MKESFSMLLGAILIFLIVPVVAESPLDAVNKNLGVIEPPSNKSIVNPMDFLYFQSNLPVIDLSGVNPAVFRNAAFAKDPGGLSSDLHTASISNFLKADPGAGASNVTQKVLRIGRAQWLEAA